MVRSLLHLSLADIVAAVALQGATTASSNIASLDALGSQYSQTLDNFAAAVMAVAGGSSGRQGLTDATSVLPLCNGQCPSPACSNAG